MSEKEMTDRVCKAIANEHFDMLGHATGRLLLSREGYKLDLGRVLETAKQHEKIVELNAYPNRLDLDWIHCRRAKELGVLIFIHPQSTPELAKRFKGNGWLANTIGNPLDTTICLSHLIFEGTLDRFPGLKICAAHGGGFLPSYANRSDAVIKTFPDRVGPLPKKNPTEYLRNGQLYFDTIMFTGEAMRHLIAEVGIEHVVMGTDYPFPWNTAPVDHILSIPGISDADKIAMLGGTAARLLGIDSYR
jgi:aminocarboxymuconate-semialdehyde decarboxylase